MKLQCYNYLQQKLESSTCTCIKIEIIFGTISEVNNAKYISSVHIFLTSCKFLLFFN